MFKKIIKILHRKKIFKDNKKKYKKTPKLKILLKKLSKNLTKINKTKKILKKLVSLKNCIENNVIYTKYINKKKIVEKFIENLLLNLKKK